MDLKKRSSLLIKRIKETQTNERREQQGHPPLGLGCGGRRGDGNRGPVCGALHSRAELVNIQGPKEASSVGGGGLQMQSPHYCSSSGGFPALFVSQCLGKFEWPRVGREGATKGERTEGGC